MRSSHNALRREVLSNWFVQKPINRLLVCDVITLKMDALSKHLHQAPVFGEDTDVI